MIIKMVKQYGCEFCKKKGLSSGHMKKHIISCTLNPNRKCKMCELLQEVQPNLSDLIKILPNSNDYLNKTNLPINASLSEINDYNGLTKKLNEVLPELRKLSNNCPACIMAAIRQSGNQVPLVTEFNFTEECKKIFQEINDLARQDAEWSTY